MKCGYWYNNNNRRVQIVCNNAGKWYQRVMQNGGDYTDWRNITAPTVIQDKLKTPDRGFIQMKRLVNEPWGVPQN